MKKTLLTCFLSCLAVLIVGGCGEAKKLDASVIKNMQAAYNGESNAAAKYALYAEKAAEQGYQSVATLFQATSKSESIHAAKHAKVLKAHGIEPQKEINLPQYISVEASLQDAEKGENYEIATMYPEFIANANAKKASNDVIETLQFALDAEKEHAALYREALQNLEDWKVPGKSFMVCAVCGYTTKNGKISSCILCASPLEKFEIFK